MDAYDDVFLIASTTTQLTRQRMRMFELQLELKAPMRRK
jgi:hypothetical protein